MRWKRKGKSLCSTGSCQKGDFNSASSLLSEAAEEILKAHEIQNKLISREANGEGMNVTLLLAHAEDHLMAAILAKDLISEMIDLYKINSKGDD